MSNFTGVTFSQQKVLPSDDAIIRRASLTDGILYGCEISYAGSTLTMGSGQMLFCGRQIRNPSAQNWAIVDATSGFARLLLTIDMTRTSSKDVFEQVVDSIEYAASQDGFPELVQENINVSGTRYQVVACVVSLGAGGITGIVNQLGPCEGGGGGGGLNFSVVDGLTQPGDPKENMIWVYTEGMTGYYFQPEQPEGMAEGEVWISTGTASQVAFNALKKGGTVMVYPLSAKQMQGGTLVDVTAKSWQDGEWVEWIPKGALFWSGSGEMVPFTLLKESAAIVNITNEYVEYNRTALPNSMATYYPTSKVSFDGYNKLKIKVVMTEYGESDHSSGTISTYARLFYSTATPTANRQFARLAEVKFNTTETEYEIGISSQTGSFYVGVCGGMVGKIYGIWLE